MDDTITTVVLVVIDITRELRSCFNSPFFSLSFSFRALVVSNTVHAMGGPHMWNKNGTAGSHASNYAVQ